MVCLLFPFDGVPENCWIKAGVDGIFVSLWLSIEVDVFEP
jgi:hypothetical protein